MELVTYTKKSTIGILVFAIAIFLLVTVPSSVSSQELPSSGTVSNVSDSGYTIEQLTGEGVVGDFVVGPGKVELSLDPGESKTIEMLVTNRMGEPKTFKMEIEDTAGTSDPDTAIVLLGDDRGPYTLKDYIQIPDMEFELQNMERARIPVTISLPIDAEPGGRYGSVLVSTVSRDSEIGGVNGAAPTSAIVSRTGTLFFVVTPGSTDVSGQLQSFQTIPKKNVFLSGPIDFGLLYENTGSVHLSPYGEIRIKNMLGDEVGFIELDPWFALPKSLRTREVSWNRELLVGRYTATAFINRGYEDVVDEISITFWVLPWKMLTFGFVGLFFLFLSIRFVATRFEFKRK